VDTQFEEMITPLPPGTIAPDFSLPRTPLAHLALRRLCGHPVIVVFYPLDWEPVSCEQLTLYQDYAGEFGRLGSRLLGISGDHALTHAAFARDAQIRFPLLADFQPRGAVARSFGVYREAQGLVARALFVLDRRSVIRFSHAYSDLLNPGVDDLLSTLEALAAEDAEHSGES
jgi:peroxiredoxin